MNKEEDIKMLVTNTTPSKITDKTPVNNTTPSKITDYFPPSPKSKQTQLDTSIDLSSNDKDITTVSNDIGDVHKAIKSSLILLTPEPSPQKDKSKSTAGEESVKSDTDSQSSDPPHCKQVLLDKSETAKVPDSKTNQKKGSKGRTAKSTSAANFTRQKPARKKKPSEQQVEDTKNYLLTDYYPIRRSNRRCKSDIQKEIQSDLERKILENIEEGIKVVDMELKGRGVIATKAFSRGDFVVEYAGDLVDLTTAKSREKEYSKNPKFGCYMYYFNFKNKNYCIDATAESGRLGRLLNHSKNGNCHTKLIEVKDKPVLILVASQDIKVGEELLYDYGDRNKESLEAHPWLNS